ncbi:MAG: DUF4339 domain-containing protein [Desulfovibrio sp.]|nr:MAG: DUF4339 domain-containing protein [Desulfovibrio sp.]
MAADDSATPRHWYVALKGKKQGPVAEDKLAKYFQARKLTGSCLVWREGFDNWTKASETELVNYIPREEFMGLELEDSSPASPASAPKQSAVTVRAPEQALPDQKPASSPSPEPEAEPNQAPGQTDGSAEDETGWHVAMDDEKVGPIPESNLADLLESEQLSPKTLVWKQGMPEWTPAWKTELVKYIGRDESRPARKTRRREVADQGPDSGMEDESLDSGPESQAAANTLGTLNIVFMVALLAWVLFTSLRLLGQVNNNFGLFGVFMIMAAGSLVTAATAGSILLFRFWHLIQDAEPGITPKTALGSMFIPVYNFYWVFQAHHTLARTMNSSMAQRQIQGRLINTQMVFIMCIAFIAAAINVLPIAQLGNVFLIAQFATCVASAAFTVLVYQSLTKAAQGILLDKGDPPDPPDNGLPLALGLGVVGGVNLLAIVFSLFISPAVTQASRQFDQDLPSSFQEDMDIQPWQEDFNTETSDAELQNTAYAIQAMISTYYAQCRAEGHPFTCMDGYDFVSDNIGITPTGWGISTRGMNDEVDGCNISTYGWDGQEFHLTWTP